MRPVPGYKVIEPFQFTMLSFVCTCHKPISRSGFDYAVTLTLCHVLLSTGLVCELNPDYGSLLLQTSPHFLREELLQEAECFALRFQGEDLLSLNVANFPHSLNR